MLDTDSLSADPKRAAQEALRAPDARVTVRVRVRGRALPASNVTSTISPLAQAPAQQPPCRPDLGHAHRQRGSATGLRSRSGPPRPAPARQLAELADAGRYGALSDLCLLLANRDDCAGRAGGFLDAEEGKSIVYPLVTAFLRKGVLQDDTMDAWLRPPFTDGFPALTWVAEPQDRALGRPLAVAPRRVVGGGAALCPAARSVDASPLARLYSRPLPEVS
jgi:hypothetical protein